jgi:hypothetical protein
MFKVWVQMLPPMRTKQPRLSAKVSALGVCHATASAAAYEQPAEAGAAGRCACTEFILRVGHSSHKPTPSLPISLPEVRRTRKPLTAYAEQALLPEPPPYMHIRPKWCFYKASLQLCFIVHLLRQKLAEVQNVVLTSVQTWWRLSTELLAHRTILHVRPTYVFQLRQNAAVSACSSPNRWYCCSHSSLRMGRYPNSYNSISALMQ